MGLLSPFSKEARSGLSLNTPKQKGIHFPFPGILLLFGQPACPAKTGDAVPAAARWDITKANYTEKIQCMGFSSSQAQLRWSNLSGWQS